MMKHSLKRECLRHLRDTFGLEDYRPGQKAAVHALLSGRDVMCILPTGAGKSLCWQLPALIHPGLTVVVSPLIALMRDQVQHLAAIGIPALSLDSLMTPEERAEAIQRLRSGAVRIAFVSPERLEQRAFRQLCSELCPWLVVVDEAHCVVQWGESFRPAYAAIGTFLHALPARPVLCALTATADEDMQHAIADVLTMKRCKRILLPVIRENLVYDVRTTLDRTGEILRLQLHSPCRTVIFCRSRARCEHLADLLLCQGLRAEFYHAGLDRSIRLEVQKRFQEGETEILCATTAFGMGVDIADVRRVIHDYLPDSLIDYIQQSGRCGRDGALAECILLFAPNDLVRRTFVQQRARERFRGHPLRRRRYLRRYWRNLHKLLKVLLTAPCIPAGAAAAFGKRTRPCGRCSACLKGAHISALPGFSRMRDWQLRAWFLRWQRDSLAGKLGIPPARVVPDHALHTAARKFVFPAQVQAPPELERLLAHFRQDQDA